MDTEANVLGTVMFDPSFLADLPRILPVDFYWDSHRHIWEIISDLYRKGRQPFEATVRDEITARGWQDRTQGRDENGNLVGNCQYLAVLTACTYPPALQQSALKLLELSRCRQAIDAANRLGLELQAGGINATERISRHVSEMKAILESACPPEQAATLAQFAQDEANRLIEYSHTAGHLPGAKTGFLWLDRGMQGGYQEGDLVTIAARPGTGKSKWSYYSLAASCAGGAGGGLISLDMARRRLLPYILPPFHNIRSENWITGGQVYNPLRDGEIGEARLLEVANGVDPENRCLVVTDPKSATIQAIEGYCRMLAERGCKVIVLDQVQNIAGWERGARDRSVYQTICKALKDIPRRYNITLAVLHQIQREGADMPEMRHLKDTGCLDEYSDFIILLHDYQSALISSCGGYILDGNKVIAPTRKNDASKLKEAQAARMISMHLAKTRGSPVIRMDVMFDYVHGIAVKGA
jgi:replicative DNA helicase